MLKKKTFTIEVERKYSKSVVSKIKNMLWDHFQINPDFESFPFDDDEFAEVSFYFVSTDEKYHAIEEQLKLRFYEVMKVINE